MHRLICLRDAKVKFIQPQCRERHLLRQQPGTLHINLNAAAELSSAAAI